MTPLRLLYFSTQFPTVLYPQLGAFSAARVRALDAAGCRVTVVAPVLLVPPLSWVRRPRQAWQFIARRLRLEDTARLSRAGQEPGAQPGILVQHPKWLPLPRPLFGWRAGASLANQARRAMRLAAGDLQPQAILASWLPDGLAAALLGAELGLPVVCIADGSDVNDLPQRYPAWGYARRVFNTRLAGVVYVSEALRRAGQQAGLQPAREAVIPNAVDVDVFTPAAGKTPDGVLKILAVGRIEAVKGYPVLLQAFAGLQRRLDHPARLTFVGDGSQRAALQTQAEALGLGEAVHFAGALAPERMPEAYRQADLLCMPSYSEGMPCSAVEAMACGLPVVASAVGGLPELVDARSGILVPPGDAGALADALLQAAGQPWDAQSIRRKIVAGFSWVQWTENILHLLNGAREGGRLSAQASEGERAWPAWR